MSDESRIVDEAGNQSGATVSLVRLRTSRIEGFVVSSGTAEFVDLEVRTSKAAEELVLLFSNLRRRLKAAEEAVGE